jgi:hypothetical protein
LWLTCENCETCNFSRRYRPALSLLYLHSLSPNCPQGCPAEPSNAVDLAEAAGAAQAERVENSGRVARTKARYEAVQTLKAQGKGIKPIMPELGAGQGDRAPLLPGAQCRGVGGQASGRAAQHPG